ncbi:MAG: VCBS repeat-containing protein [Planctomycetaceae bacterium]|nr:VCBS repeat-containing protein [Planctomycetaceae bacterium]
MTHKVRFCFVVAIVLGLGGSLWISARWWPSSELQEQPSSLTDDKTSPNENTRPTLSGSRFQTDSSRLAASSTNWPTEQFADRASQTLTKVSEALKHTTSNLPSSECFAETFSLTFDSTLPRKIFSNAQTSVLRIADLQTPTELQGSDAITKFLNLLANGPAPATHIKPKIITVQFGNHAVSTEVVVEASTQTPQHSWQRLTHWEYQWISNDANLPRLVSARLINLEETQRSGPAWFKDQTLAVIGETDSFQQQLIHGLQYWLTRIETAHGMEYFSKHGLSIVDINDDGLDDLYVCQPGGLPNRLFLQQQDGTAWERSAEYGLNLLDRTSSAVFVDLDNDGDQDAAIATMMGICLYENADLKFRMRQLVKLPDIDLQGISAVDYDNDGDLDLYQLVDYASQASRSQQGLPAFVYHNANDGGANHLLQNNISANGDWNFQDVTTEVGLDTHNQRHSLAASWEDYDNDGDQDLYVANDYGANCLYRNDGQQFAEVAAEQNLIDFGSGMSVSWGDYNRDGQMDLYVGNMFSSAGNRITPQSGFLPNASPQRKQLYRRFAKGNSLFQNIGTSFEETGSLAGVEMGRWAWSSLFCDINNDGWEDLLVANGYITTHDPGDL